MKEILMQQPFILLGLSTLDIVFGFLAAASLKQVQSSIMKKGLITHTMIVTGSFLLYFYAPHYNMTEVAGIYTAAFIFMNIVSIAETYQKIGGVIPQPLQKYLKKDPE